jgi:tetratricopeptide (TPR) repeat protein
MQPSWKTWFTFLVVTAAAVFTHADVARADSPEATFHRAYYLEREQGDVETAAKLYDEVVNSDGATEELKARAQARLARCREAIAAEDFARLMPIGTIAYVEVNNPGDQVHRLADMLGLMGPDVDAQDPAASEYAGGKHIAISPVLIRELLGIRGFAVAVTGFDPVNKMPSAVAVFDAGSVDVIRGIIETGLPAAAQPVEPIEGFKTYNVEGKAFVCLTARMVIVSPQRGNIASVVRKLKEPGQKSFATNPAMVEVLQHRQDAAIFFCVNAKPVVPILVGMAGVSRELAMARGVLDIDSLQWIAGRAGVDDDGVSLDVALALDAGHHNLLCNAFRTTPISADLLKCIPNGAAGFVAAGLGYTQPVPEPPTPDEGKNLPSVTGLDFGREIFANIVDLAVYALPPADETAEVTGPVPDVAVVIRVNDPTKSRALWTQILGIASLATGAPTIEGAMERISDVDVQVYSFPANVSAYFATVGDKVIVSGTRYAMTQALHAASGGDNILSDAAFQPGLKNIGDHTSKAAVIHAGRCFELAKRYMSPGDISEAEPVVATMGDAVASLICHESDERFHLSVAVTGLPNLGPLLARQLQLGDRTNQLQKKMKTAYKEKRFQDALEAADALIAENPHDQGVHQFKFRVLAVGLKDPDVARAWAEVYRTRFADNANALNNLAWGLLTEEQYEHQYNDAALTLAERACAVQPNWAYLDTLALAKFETGDVDAALELQERALAQCPESRRDILQKPLARYRAAQQTPSAEQSE